MEPPASEPAAAPSQATFRDPAGSVELLPHCALRSVSPAYSVDILAFLVTPLCERLVAESQLVASRIIFADDLSGAPQLLLRHPRISFVSYPAEWPPTLWLAAAELTLTLSDELLAEGWILKDATPLNVLFQGTSSIFVDVLSIQRADLTLPVWFAYAQFVRSFLLPMLAHSQLGWPLAAALLQRDGIEPEELFAALPWTRRLTRPALTAVTLPQLLSQRSRQNSANITPSRVTDPELCKHILAKTLARLRAAMRQAMPSKQSSQWSHYTDTHSHYSEVDHAEKQGFLASIFAQQPPQRVLDVGCNTGAYSRLAAEAGAEVVAIDSDVHAVERLATELCGSNLNILPLCVDFAHPTPATGWQNRETASFLARAEGHFDTVLLLAVLHHLLLSSQVPLAHIAALCSKITTYQLIVEWVPPTDPKFIQVLRGRGALYSHLTEAAFRAAFAVHFDTANQTLLSNGRLLLHFKKKRPAMSRNDE